VEKERDTPTKIEAYKLIVFLRQRRWRANELDEKEATIRARGGKKGGGAKCSDPMAWGLTEERGWRLFAFPKKKKKTYCLLCPNEEARCNETGPGLPSGGFFSERKRNDHLPG